MTHNKLKLYFFICGIGLFSICNIVYYIANRKLKEMADHIENVSSQSDYYQTLLENQMEEAITCLESEHIILDDMPLFAAENQRNTLSQLCKNEKKLFIRYKQENCGDCIRFIIPYIQQLCNESEIKNIIFLASYADDRLMEIFKKTNKLRNDFYNIGTKELDLPVENKNQPYLFILDNSMKVQHVFIPQKALPKITEKYFNMIERILQSSFVSYNE